VRSRRPHRFASARKTGRHHRSRRCGFDGVPAVRRACRERRVPGDGTRRARCLRCGRMECSSVSTCRR
jgi:hypothetical protein